MTLSHIYIYIYIYIYIDQFSGRLLSFHDFVIVIFQIRNHNQNTKKLSILFLFLKIKNPQKML
jgi:hypothetical protein